MAKSQSRPQSEVTSFYVSTLEEMVLIRKRMLLLENAWVGFEARNHDCVSRCLDAERLRSLLWERYVILAEIAKGIE